MAPRNHLPTEKPFPFATPVPSTNPLVARFRVHLDPNDPATTEPASLIPEDLTTLNDTQLQRKEDSLVTAYERLKKAPISKSNVEERKRHAAAIGQIRTEVANRVEESKRLEAEAAEIDDAVAPAAASDAATTEEEEGTESTETTETAETGTETTESAPQSVAASAVAARGTRRVTSVTERPAAPRADRAQARTEAAPIVDRRRASVTAAGDVPGFSAGSKIDEDKLGYAFAEKALALLAGAGEGHGSGKVLRLQVEYPPDRKLGRAALDNEELIQEVVADASRTRGLSYHGADSLVAAGGLCAPLAVDYSLQTIATAGRPVKAALASFGADRGGLRFITPPHLQDVAPGIGVWEEATDAAWTPGRPTKPFVVINCGTEETVEVGAVTASAVNGNFNARFFPEQWAAWYTLMQALFARVADSRLLTQISAASTQVYAPRILGTARDVLTHLGTAAANYRNRNRMDRDAILEALLPETLLEQMRVDMTRQQPGDSAVSMADAEFLGYLANLNIEPYWYKDSPTTGPNQLATAQGIGVLEGFPSQVQIGLFHPGAFLYLDGGQLDLGIDIREFTLDQENRVAAFWEGFESVAYRGVESNWITMTVAPSGESSAPIAVLAGIAS